MGDKLLELFPAEAPLFSFLTSALFITCISEMLSREMRTLLIYQWHQVFGILSIAGWLERWQVHLYAQCLGQFIQWELSSLCMGRFIHPHTPLVIFQTLLQLWGMFRARLRNFLCSHQDEDFMSFECPCRKGMAKWMTLKFCWNWEFHE